MRSDVKLVSNPVIWKCPMQAWPVQDAKARFSEFLETCLAEGPQMVTKRGSGGCSSGSGGRVATPKGGSSAFAEATSALRARAPRSCSACPRSRPQAQATCSGLNWMYLLDANVVSELRKPKPHGGVLAWLGALEDVQLYLSAVTMGEIQAGIELTREQDLAKASEIVAWLELVATSCNVLPMDAAAFRVWAQLMHRLSDTVYEDAMIAATARIHGLTVATRNVADFKGFGVPLLNPFKA